MKINILTLFPEMFTAVTGSILGRAAEKGLLKFNFVNIRDFSQDKHKKVDDYPFGGGQGMVMMADPVFRALESVEAKGKKLIYMSPRGRVLDKDKIQALSAEEEITILCGHYEGVDQRILDYWEMEEISIGDYILTGGELAAMVLVDAVARLIPRRSCQRGSSFRGIGVFGPSGVSPVHQAEGISGNGSPRSSPGRKSPPHLSLEAGSGSAADERGTAGSL